MKIVYVLYVRQAPRTHAMISGWRGSKFGTIARIHYSEMEIPFLVVECKRCQRCQRCCAMPRCEGGNASVEGDPRRHTRRDLRTRMLISNGASKSARDENRHSKAAIFSSSPAISCGPLYRFQKGYEALIRRTSGTNVGTAKKTKVNRRGGTIVFGVRRVRIE